MLTLWGLAQATDDGPTHFVGGLIGVPLMMALTAPVLIWLNGLYLRVTGILARARGRRGGERLAAGACAGRWSR